MLRNGVKDICQVNIIIAKERHSDGLSSDKPSHMLVFKGKIILKLANFLCLVPSDTNGDTDTDTIKSTQTGW